jgi:mono/diheme cytochrome c family protein
LLNLQLYFPPPVFQNAQFRFVHALLISAILSFSSIARAAGPGLQFDSTVKQYNAKPFEMNAPFIFYVTNISTDDINITKAKASCGCTTARMPTTPWLLHPGESGGVDVSVNLTGKMGLLTKTITFDTSVGMRMVTLRVAIPSPEAAANSDPDRQLAMAKAVVDPQAIFKNDCARCHADKGRDAMGEELYVADCAICHESPHRESIVPDLHALRRPTDLAYWTSIIKIGKPHSLMPAFAAANGGPLSDNQVASLAAYLNRVLPSAATLPAITNAAASVPSRLAATH